jgi:pimeloyl-ACP methyl ester carboxylesterase
VPDTSQEWDGVRAHLSRTDVITPNLPGFASPVPAGFGATKEEYVAWLIGEIEQLSEPVDLVGHDWGSLLVQRVVSTRPDLIRTWAAGSGDALVDALAEQLGREQATQVVKHIDDTMKDCILKLYRSAASGFDEWHDAIDAIDRPGVVFWGADDPYVTSDFGERLAQRTHAKLVMYPDSGHWWPVTKSPDVARELEALWG